MKISKLSKLLTLVTIFVLLSSGSPALASPVCTQYFPSSPHQTIMTIRIPMINPIATQDSGPISRLFGDVLGSSIEPIFESYDLKVTTKVQPKISRSTSEIKFLLTTQLGGLMDSIYRRGTSGKPLVHLFDVRAFSKEGKKLEEAGVLDLLAGWFTQKGLPTTWIHGLDLSRPLHYERLAALISHGKILEDNALPFLQVLKKSSQHFESFLNFYFHNDYPVLSRRHNAKDVPFLDWEERIDVFDDGMMLVEDHDARRYISGAVLMTWFSSATNLKDILHRWKYLSQVADQKRDPWIDNYLTDLKMRLPDFSTLSRLSIDGYSLRGDLPDQKRRQTLMALEYAYRYYVENPTLSGLAPAQRQLIRNSLPVFFEEFGLADSFSSYWGRRFKIRSNRGTFDVHQELRHMIFGESPYKIRGGTRYWGWWIRPKELKIEPIPATRSQSALNLLHGDKATREIFWVDTLDKEAKADLDSLRLAVNSIEGKPVSAEVLLRLENGEWRPLAFEVVGDSLVPVKSVRGQKLEQFCMRCHTLLKKGYARPIQMNSVEDLKQEFNIRSYDWRLKDIMEKLLRK